MDAETIQKELILDFEKAELIFGSMLDCGRPATYAERQFLRVLGYENEIHLQREVERLRRVRRLQQISGTESDRAKQAKEVADAQGSLDRQGPKLTAKLEAIQAEIRGLERDSQVAKTRLEQMHTAIEGLRECVPKFVREQVTSDLAFVGGTLGMERGELRVRRDELQILIERDEGPTREYKAELKDLQKILSQVESDFDQACVDISAPLNHYVV